MATYIDHNLSNKYFGSVVVSGKDRSGKSTLCTRLASKYRYAKFSYTYEVEYPYNWDDAKYVQVHDRSPLFEFYAYGDFKNTNPESENKRKLMEELYIKSHIKYYNNPLFIIFLHSIWDDGTQPSSVYNNDVTITNRYVDIVEILVKLKLPVIVCTENGIRQYNTLYSDVHNMPENYFEWR